MRDLMERKPEYSRPFKLPIPIEKIEYHSWWAKSGETITQAYLKGEYVINAIRETNVINKQLNKQIPTVVDGEFWHRMDIETHIKRILVEGFRNTLLRGRATCSVKDTFDAEKGKEIARTRLLMKLRNRYHHLLCQAWVQYQTLADIVAQSASWQMNKYLDLDRANIEFLED